MKSKQFLIPVSPVILLIIILYSAFPCQALPPGFEVHFNDASHSNPNNIDIDLADMVNNAQTTVAGAFYSIGRARIVDAFINAFTRGVEVRIITDFDNSNTTGCQRLKSAGITVIDEVWDPNISESYAHTMHMHHKFCVVDNRIVWTGSYNITDSGTTYNNNNAVEIECPDLAEAYLAEFNEMWGATSGEPGADCHFSGHKTHSQVHDITCGGIPLGVYFSPTTEHYPDRAMDAIHAKIQNAVSSVYFCMFAFTSASIADKIIAAHDAGLTVRGVMDDQQAGYSSSKYQTLVNAGVEVKKDNEVDPHGNFLHHKFSVIDYNGVTPVVITGSYNWSEAAQHTNDENTIIIYDSEVAELYYNEYYKCYTGTDPTPQDPTITIDSNQEVYSAGNFFRVWVDIANPAESRTLDEYVILDLGEAFGDERYYFWPDWTHDVSFKRLYLSADGNINQDILNLVLPYPLGPGGPFTMYAALLNPSTGQLAADYDFIQFSFE